MPTIDALSSATVLYDTDAIPVYSPTQEDTRKATLVQVTAYVQAAIEGEPDETVYGLSIVGSGFISALLPTVAGGSLWAQLTLTGPAPTGTIILPGIDSRAPGQEVLVTITQAVSSLTVSGNGASVLGAPTSLSANGFFRLRYDSISNTWYRVG